MKVRTGAALAIALVAAGAPAAGAAARVKPACQLVVDAAGDATSFGAVPSRDAIDILSADVASGARNLVGVVRLASAASDPTMAPGATYRLGWTVGGIAQEFALVRYSDGGSVVTFDPNTGALNDEISAKALVDSASSSITWTLSRKANPQLAKQGAKLGALYVVADAAANLAIPRPNPAVPSVTIGANIGGGGDEASSGKTYTDRAPSCVKGV